MRSMVFRLTQACVQHRGLNSSKDEDGEGVPRIEKRDVTHDTCRVRCTL
jgi:hypothetical protein